MARSRNFLITCQIPSEWHKFQRSNQPLRQKQAYVCNKQRAHKMSCEPTKQMKTRADASKQMAILSQNSRKYTRSNSLISQYVQRDEFIICAWVSPTTVHQAPTYTTYAACSWKGIPTTTLLLMFADTCVRQQAYEVGSKGVLAMTTCDVVSRSIKSRMQS